MHPILHNFSLQAGGSHYPTINTRMQESFAQMIINDCIRLAEEEEDRFLEMGETDLAYAMQNYQMLLRKHFGLEHGREANT